MADIPSPVPPVAPPLAAETVAGVSVGAGDSIPTWLVVVAVAAAIACLVFLRKPAEKPPKE